MYNIKPKPSVHFIITSKQRIGGGGQGGNPILILFIIELSIKRKWWSIVEILQQ
jgi:hypothetical protein